MASRSREPPSPGTRRSASGARQLTVTLTEAGCPTGTLKPAVLTWTELGWHCRPWVVRLLLATDWASCWAWPAVRAMEAARALAQSGLWPSNARLLDPAEAALTGAAPEGLALLVLGFESADHPLDAWIARAVECCRDLGGDVADGPTTSTDGAEGARAGLGQGNDRRLRRTVWRETRESLPACDRGGPATWR